MRKLSVFGLEAPAQFRRPHPCRAAAAAGGAAAPATDVRPMTLRPSGPSYLMDLRRLEIFVKVAELGSFSRAAEPLPDPADDLRARPRSRTSSACSCSTGSGGAPRPRARASPRSATPPDAGAVARGAAGARSVPGPDERRARRRRPTIPGEYVLPALIGPVQGQVSRDLISLLIGAPARCASGSRRAAWRSGWSAPARPPRARLERADAGRARRGRPHRSRVGGRQRVTLADVRREPMILRERGRARARRSSTRWARPTRSACSASWARWAPPRPIKQAVRAGVGSRSSPSGRWRTSAGRPPRLREAQGPERLARLLPGDPSRPDRSPLAQAFVDFVESQGPARAS